MPYRITPEIFERSSSVGSYDFIENRQIKDYTSKWVTVTYNATIDLEPERQNIYAIPKPVNNITIPQIYVVDGSDSQNREDRKKLNEAVFLKIALLRIPAEFRCTKITGAREEIEKDKIVYTVCIPRAGFHQQGMSTFETLSETFWRFMSEEHPDLLETYKWLIYRKWNPEQSKSLPFRCPFCEPETRTVLLDIDSDHATCSQCQHIVRSTDFFIGYHRRMKKKGEIRSIPGMLRNDLEILVQFNEIRKLQENNADMSQYLFVFDGRMQLQDDEIGRSVVYYLRYMHAVGRPLFLVSQEKSGDFFDHIKYLEGFLQSRSVFIPSDTYMQSTILGREKKKTKKGQHIYGSFHNLGIKLFANFGERQMLILNVPTGVIRSREMQYDQLMGLSEILLTIEKCGLNTNRLKWIEWAHNAASISQHEYEVLERHYFGPALE